MLPLVLQQNLFQVCRNVWMAFSLATHLSCTSWSNQSLLWQHTPSVCHLRSSYPRLDGATPRRLASAHLDQQLERSDKRTRALFSCPTQASLHWLQHKATPCMALVAMEECPWLDLVPVSHHNNLAASVCSRFAIDQSCEFTFRLSVATEGSRTLITTLIQTSSKSEGINISQKTVRQR